MIVGEGVNQSGDLRAWIAIIPEPSTGLLLGAGLIILSLCGRVVIPIEPLREWLLTRTEAEKAAADQVAQQILDELGR